MACRSRYSGQAELGRQHADGQAFLPVDALHGHQMVEAAQQQRRDGLATVIGGWFDPGRAIRAIGSIRCDRDQDRPGFRRIKQAPCGQCRQGQRGPARWRGCRKCRRARTRWMSVPSLTTKTINSTDMTRTASRSRRRPATRSSAQVRTVCTAAETARTRSTIDSNRPPALASIGHVVQARNAQKPSPTTASQSAPCQRRTTKSSSKVARAHSQTITGLAAMIGIVHDRRLRHQWRRYDRIGSAGGGHGDGEPFDRIERPRLRQDDHHHHQKQACRRPAQAEIKRRDTHAVHNSNDPRLRRGE